MASQQSTCANCKITGLPVMPALYAALPVNAAPSLPTGIGGDRVKTVVINTPPALPPGVSGPGLDSAQYDYGLRVVRAGYIYLFYVSGSRGANYWDVYTVNADGCMKLQPPSDFAQMAMPPQEVSHCDTRGHVAVRTHYFVIEKPESCGTVWVAFSEHKWSRQTVENYTTDAALRARRMQPIEPKSWLASPMNPHAVEATPGNLKHVMEYRPNAELLLTPPTRGISSGSEGGYVGAELSKQSTRYPVNLRGGQETEIVKRMQVTGRRPDGKSHPPVLLALWDAIGIAHELQGYRSEVAGRVAQYQEGERSLQVTALGLIDGAQKTMEAAAEQKVLNRRALALKATHSHRTGPDAAHNEQKALRKEAAKRREPTRSRYNEAADLVDQWQAQDVPYSYIQRLYGLLRMLDGPDWKPNALNPLTKEGMYTQKLGELKTEVNSYLVKRDPGKAQEIKQAREHAWPEYEAKIRRNGKKSIEEFRANYNNFLAVTDVLIDARTVQLIKWLESPLLIDTLHDYDKAELACGVAFERAVALAINGIGHCASGGKKLDEWVKELDLTKNTNLFWRAFALNHATIEAEVKVTLDKAKANPIMFTAVGFDKAMSEVKALKTAFDLYKKAQSFANTNASAGSQKGSKAFDIKLGAVASKGAGKLNNAAGDLVLTAGDRVYKLFRIDKIGDTIGEKLITHLFNVSALIHPDESIKFIKTEVEGRMALLRQAQIDIISRGSRDAAEQLARLKGQIPEEEHARLTAKAAEIERTMVRQTAAQYGKESVAMAVLEAHAEARANPKAPLTKLWGEFLSNPAPDKADGIRLAVKDVRLAAIVGLIETCNLAKLLAWDLGYTGKRDPKTAALVLASAMSVASAVADVGAVAAKSVFSSDAWSYQRLKLWGGSLACGATLIGAVLDLFDAKKEFSKDDRTRFGVLYLVKSGLGVLSFAATAMTTFTYAAPLVQRMTGKAAAGKSLTVVGQRATNIVARRILFVSMGGWVTAIIFGVQILIIILDDDALVKWCARSAFGVDFEVEPYPTGEKQVEAFHSAMSEVNSSMLGMFG